LDRERTNATSRRREAPHHLQRLSGFFRSINGQDNRIDRKGTRHADEDFFARLILSILLILSLGRNGFAFFALSGFRDCIFLSVFHSYYKR